MKAYSKIIFVLAASLSFFYANAQETNLLKAFINKNDIAVRSFQKHAIQQNDPASEILVKEILKLQSSSVKLFNSDPEKSADIAFIVREKSSVFLNKYSKGSLEYLKLTDKEKVFFSSPKPIAELNSYLNQAELEKINSIDVKDPHLFDNLNTRIN